MARTADEFTRHDAEGVGGQIDDPYMDEQIRQTWAKISSELGHHESIEYARGKPNELLLLKQRQRQIEYDLKIQYPDLKDRPANGELIAIKNRLKEL